ncbi:DUF4190 domain-containing protein [Nocardia yamanashiensis]|uniref:DUF4190 domain-containing protein n=1 Tax=Nocardia yamanashiensis TaxID=209247 RepID=UPI001E4EE059|nr:DUF4190 domain-containing protein [Nocardia yamanashiensis]UGT40517.1 DUF4190 domain-containing protein [Nocardia yamanashiensis]
MAQYPPPGQYGQNPPPPPGGYPPPGGGGYWQGEPKSKGLAIAALVLGILGILTFWTVIFTILGIIFGLLAMIFGLIALSKVRAGTGDGKGMALSGLILGAISLIGGIIAGILVWFVFSETGTTDYISCINDAKGDQAKIDQCERDFQQRVEDRFSITFTPEPT